MIWTRTKPLARRQYLKVSVGTISSKRLADYVLAITLLKPIEEPKEA